jgi:hypothetical protein
MNSIKQFLLNILNKLASALGTTIYILGIILGLVAAFFYEKDKRSSAEALLQNTDMNKKLDNTNTQIGKDEGLIQSQQQIQQNIQNGIKNQQNHKDSLQDIADLINKKDQS